ncbi:uncharacterized protein BDZ83DRAFT_96138 [Colletotrichum acutatum]|uniref:Secreted protein n=1 Tax=Glomerella acutata TaxID=27357 RepID=A0AAD8X9G0_GLOAC|nr:uncharacterized protein BDZ83DRAFT_96138 [Colletotrichum acutatum]KAK1712567.1 hypothetical protein BDZ83DRAFT_96138 [Colletotrichum acutatum]
MFLICLLFFCTKRQLPGMTFFVVTVPKSHLEKRTQCPPVVGDDAMPPYSHSFPPHPHPPKKGQHMLGGLAMKKERRKQWTQWSRYSFFTWPRPVLFLFHDRRYPHYNRNKKP